MFKPNFLKVFEKIIGQIENLRINALVIALYLSFLISLRDILEQLFFEKYYSIYQLMHHFFFYFLMLMAGILVISIIVKTNIINTTLVVSSGFILIILPPLVDHYIYLRNFPYEYVLPREFITNMVTFFLFTPKAGKGIFVEILAILFLASCYVFIKTRRIWRSLLTGFSLYFLVGLSVTPRLYLPIPPMSNPKIWNSRHIIYFSFYLGISIILGILFLYRINRALPKALLKELSSFRTLHFILMVLVGVYFNKALSFFGFPDFLFVVSGIILIVLIWLSTVLINNVYDLPIDRISNPKRPLAKGDVSSSLYLNTGLVLSVIALAMSVVLGALPFTLTLIAVSSSFIYSMPPLRLRKRLFSTLFIGWGSSLAFLIGYFSHILIANISISREVIILSILIFIAFSVGPLTKDLKDYQGDLRHGIKTFFTVYGIKKGTRIVSILLGFSLLIPLFLFHKVMDIFFLLFVSAFISLFFYLRGRLFISFFGYGAVFSYCALRILNII
jgi:4-hydroxybenzoate polyprenyltransferase